MIELTLHHGGQGRKKPFSARLWLTIVALCQVFLTPLIAFTLTYLFEFSFFGETINISFQKEMIPWISAASLMYGMVALFLALIIGGYTPHGNREWRVEEIFEIFSLT